MPMTQSGSRDVVKMKAGLMAAGFACLSLVVSGCSSHGTVDQGLEVEGDSLDTVETQSVGQKQGIEGKVLADIVPAQVAKRRAKASSPGRTVSAPTSSVEPAPFERNGSTMNAYYFVRGEGSWVDLAQRIYRDPVRADDLKIWNPSVQITPGAIVYYRSPARAAEDQSMKPFYQDFGAEAESYTVKKGETLASISQAKFGSAKSKPEIQAANPGINLTTLKPGAVILIPPTEVNNTEVLQRIAQAQLEVQRQERKPEETAQAQSVTSTASPETTTTSVDEPQREPASWETGPTGKVLSALNALPVPPQYLGAGVLVLLGVAFLLRRRSS